MIYIIRHGQTEANKKHIYYGRSKSALTQKGVAQHDLAVEKMKGIKLDKIVSSPRDRCTSLAKSLCRNRDVDYTVDERLSEMDFGIFEGLNYDEAQEKYPDVWDKWVSAGDDFALQDGESKAKFNKRIAEFAGEIINSYENENIAIATHGGVVTSLICNLLELGDENVWRFAAKNGAVTKIEISDVFDVGIDYVLMGWNKSLSIDLK